MWVRNKFGIWTIFFYYKRIKKGFIIFPSFRAIYILSILHFLSSQSRRFKYISLSELKNRFLIKIYDVFPLSSSYFQVQNSKWKSLNNIVMTRRTITTRTINHTPAGKRPIRLWRKSEKLLLRIFFIESSPSTKSKQRKCVAAVRQSLRVVTTNACSGRTDAVSVSPNEVEPFSRVWRPSWVTSASSYPVSTPSLNSSFGQKVRR